MNFKSIIYKLIELKSSIYFDIFINCIFMIVLLTTLFSSSYSLVPIDLVKPFIGINNLLEVMRAFNILMIFFNLVFLIQSLILLNGLSKGSISKSLVATLLYAKWFITTMACGLPYLYNHPISPLFLLLNICILFLLWYQLTEHTL